MKNMILLLVLIFICSSTQAARLPTYLNQCNKDVPAEKFNECFLKSANLAIRDIVKGDIHYDIPKLTPYKYGKPVIVEDTYFLVALENLEICGLEQTEVTKINLDLINGIFDMTLRMPYIVEKANYEIESNLLDVPIVKNGQFIDNLVGVNVTYSAKFQSNIIDQDRYFEIISHEVDYNVVDDNVIFENVFNKNEAIGQKLYKSFTSKFQKIKQDNKQDISKKISEFITSLFNGILSRVPESDMFFTNATIRALS